MTVAEGIDATARNEFNCLSGIGAGSEDILLSPSSMASGAGLTLCDINATVARGTGLDWMPRSDTSLYGNIAKKGGFNAILQAETEDVALVFRSGTVLYGEADLVQALAPTDNCETVDVCGQARRMCAEREFGQIMASIVAASPAAYLLFACDSRMNGADLHFIAHSTRCLYWYFFLRRQRW